MFEKKTKSMHTLFITWCRHARSGKPAKIEPGFIADIEAGRPGAEAVAEAEYLNELPWMRLREDPSSRRRLEPSKFPMPSRQAGATDVVATQQVCTLMHMGILVNYTCFRYETRMKHVPALNLLESSGSSLAVQYHGLTNAVSQCFTRDCCEVVSCIGNAPQAGLNNQRPHQR